jgi:hypothetical protein
MVTENLKLNDIGKKYRTDKCDETHTFNYSTYLDNYEFHFEKFRYKNINVLEIGVLTGASIRTWKEYFPNATIYGLDIDPNRKFEEDRIIINIGSQNDTQFLEKTYENINFDIIVDDGSHVNEFTINSFNYLFYNKLNSGGIYVIEDLLCSYEPAMKWWPGMSHNKENSDGDSFINFREDMDSFFNNKIHDLDKSKGEIKSMHFYSMMCFIYKIN